MIPELHLGRTAAAWTPLRSVRLLVAVLGLLLAVLVATAPGAQAHASVISVDPAEGTVLPDSPASVSVTFTEPVTLGSVGNDLLDAAGAPVDAEVAVVDNVVTYTPADTLDDGTYIISWRVISADSHPVAGGSAFSVGAPSKDVVAVPQDLADRQVTVLKAIFEFLRYAGLLALAGLLFLAGRLATDAVAGSVTFQRRIRRTSYALAAAAVVGAVLLIPLTWMWQEGATPDGLWSPSLWRDALGGAPALSALGITVGVLVALMTSRRGFGPVTAGALLVALASLVVVGHTRVYGPAWLVWPTDLLHVATAALWFGGLIGLCILLTPAEDAEAPALADAVRRFSAWAVWLVVALSVAGVLLWWRIANSFETLWTTNYGRLLLVKVALVLVVVAIAAYNRARLVPDPKRPSAAQLSTLRRTVGVEALLLTVVVVVTGVLISQSPREDAAPSEQTPAVTDPSKVVMLELELNADVSALIFIKPGALGRNSIELSFSDAAGIPFDVLETPELSISLSDGSVGPLASTLASTGQGTFEGAIDFPFEGRWTVSLGARTSEFDRPVAFTDIVVP